MDFKGVLPLWSAAWSADSLRSKFKTIGQRAFNQGFRMRAYSDGDFTFPNFKKALAAGEGESIPDPIPSDWQIIFGIDLASPRRPGNVIYCGAVDPHRIKRPLDIRVIKGSSPEVAHALKTMAAMWRPALIVVENNAYQGALIDWISQYKEDFPFWEAIVPFNTQGSNKNDPALGIAGLDVEFLNGAWSVPREINPNVNGHEIDCACGPCVWVKEVSLHPNAAYTDTVMAMWFFREGCKRVMQGLEDGAQYELQDPVDMGAFGIPADELGPF